MGASFQHMDFVVETCTEESLEDLCATLYEEAGYKPGLVEVPQRI
jgi:hypothetical protein